MRTDKLFYRLFQQIPAAFRLLALDYPANAYRFQSVELKEIGFRLDGVYLPADEEPDLPVIFVEAQFQPDEQFYARFITQICIYLYQNPSDRPWLALAIFPDRKTDKPPKRSFANALESGSIKRLYLEDIQDNSDPKLLLFQLITCPEAETDSRLLPFRNGHVKLNLEDLDLIETILIYKFPHLTREEVRKMVAIHEVELQQTRFFQEIAEEYQARGRAEGKAEGEATLLKRRLFRRFGSLPTEIETKIANASIGQIETWFDRELDATSLDDVFGKN